MKQGFSKIGPLVISKMIPIHYKILGKQLQKINNNLLLYCPKNLDLKLDEQMATFQFIELPNSNRNGRVQKTVLPPANIIRTRRLFFNIIHSFRPPTRFYSQKQVEIYQNDVDFNHSNNQYFNNLVHS